MRTSFKYHCHIDIQITTRPVTRRVFRSTYRCAIQGTALRFISSSPRLSCIYSPIINNVAIYQQQIVYPYKVLLFWQLYHFSNFSTVYLANNGIVYYRKFVFLLFHVWSQITYNDSTFAVMPFKLPYHPLTSYCWLTWIEFVNLLKLSFK